VPTVLRIDGFRFFFYANEGNEPAHIHVRKAAGEAKFWLKPNVSLAWVRGFNPATITALLALVRANRTFFLEKWNEFFAS
jgi:hypothetical protein